MKEMLQRPIVRWFIGISFVVGLAAAWYLISPLFLTSEVNDAFPMAAAAQIPDDMTRAEVEAAMVQAAPRVICQCQLLRLDLSCCLGDGDERLHRHRGDGIPDDF